MVNYVLLEVSLHNLKADNAEKVRKQIDTVLRTVLSPEYESDLSVELIESAGSLTK
jgi:hypothetical protein